MITHFCAKLKGILHFCCKKIVWQTAKVVRRAKRLTLRQWRCYRCGGIVGGFVTFYKGHKVYKFEKVSNRLMFLPKSANSGVVWRLLLRKFWQYGTKIC